jgi:putative endonuclease
MDYRWEKVFSTFAITSSLKGMFYVYVLYSESAGKKYTGYTTNLTARLSQHNEGFSGSFTKGKGPWKLIYSETYNNRTEAQQREKYLKTGAGRDFIKEKTGY